MARISSASITFYLSITSVLLAISISFVCEEHYIGSSVCPLLHQQRTLSKHTLQAPMHSNIVHQICISNIRIWLTVQNDELSISNQDLRRFAYKFCGDRWVKSLVLEKIYYLHWGIESQINCSCLSKRFITWGYFIRGHFCKTFPLHKITLHLLGKWT